MELLKQPNSWTCLPTSVSMAFGISLSWLIEKIGHDGSEILWPSEPEPIRRKAYHLEEIQAVLFGMDWCLVPYVFGVHYNPSKIDSFVAQYDFAQLMTLGVLRKHDGVLLGTYVGRSHRHAVAWNAKEFRIYDPEGHYSDLESFSPFSFHAARRA